MKFLFLCLCFSTVVFCGDYSSPNALCQGGSPSEVWVTDLGKSRVYRVDIEQGHVRSTISLPDLPSGVVCSGSALYITMGVPKGRILAIDPSNGSELFSISAGHSPCAPVLSTDKKAIIVCNRFDNQVAAYDLVSGLPRWKTSVPREPVAAALSPDGQRLVVANLLPDGPATKRPFSATVSVLSSKNGHLLANMPLPNGSTGLHGIAISPQGRFAYVTHTIGRYQSPTKQVDFGWMNSNAITVIDLAKLKTVATILLDELTAGAANPWGIAVSETQIVVAHAGSRELSIIDRTALHEKLDRLERGEATSKISTELACVQNDLEFLNDIRKRLSLSSEGPRAVLITNQTAIVAAYFSGELVVVSLDHPEAPKAMILSASPAPDEVRKGEILFCSAAMCRQKWQSCSTCHPDARVDGFNWDLLNDGIGNPKNVKSLLNAHRTPPAMWSGVRETAGTAVRAGFRHIQFAEIAEADAKAVDAFLMSLPRLPGPVALDEPGLTSVRRGQEIFKSAGCLECHSGEYFTDGKPHAVGTGDGIDSGKPYITPSLVECWRTAPYLHDGRAATIHDLLQTHGHARGLTVGEQEDLENYLLSL